MIRELTVFAAEAETRELPGEVADRAHSLCAALSAFDPADVQEFFIG